jgi:hypothetical protein
MGVEIRTLRRQEHRFHPTGLEQHIKRLSEFRVPVMEQISFAQQEPVERIGQLSSTLLHEGGRGMGRDAGKLHPACRQFHDHEHVIRHQPVPRRHLHGEEVRGGEELPMELQELDPAHPRFPPLRGRFQVVATQDIAHG